MPNFAQVADVKPLIGARPLGPASVPSEEDVERWLEEHEAELNELLLACGISTDFSKNGKVLVAKWIARAVAGLVRMAHAAGGGDGQNEDGQKWVDEWNDRLVKIQNDATLFGQMLVGASSSSSTDSASKLRSHVTNHPDGKTVANGDFAPRFTTEEKF